MTTLLGLLVGAAGIWGVEVHRLKEAGWRRRSWLHFCLWDRACQSHGAPRRIYIGGFYLDLSRVGDTTKTLDELE